MHLLRATRSSGVERWLHYRMDRNGRKVPCLLAKPFVSRLDISYGTNRSKSILCSRHLRDWSHIVNRCCRNHCLSATGDKTWSHTRSNKQEVNEQISENSRDFLLFYDSAPSSSRRPSPCGRSKINWTLLSWGTCRDPSLRGSNRIICENFLFCSDVAKETFYPPK